MAINFQVFLAFNTIFQFSIRATNAVVTKKAIFVRNEENGNAVAQHGLVIFDSCDENLTESLKDQELSNMEKHTKLLEEKLANVTNRLISFESLISAANNPCMF